MYYVILKSGYNNENPVCFSGNVTGENHWNVKWSNDVDRAIQYSFEGNAYLDKNKLLQKIDKKVEKLTVVKVKGAEI